MPWRQPATKRLSTALRWPAGVALTSFRYMWRITPVHRWEYEGSLEEDSPPTLPGGVSLAEIQALEDGVGPLVHRLYWTTIRGSRLSPDALVERIGEDLDRIAPSEFASFQKLEGDKGRLRIGDTYVVRMPGPWDGPVRVIDVGRSSFRLATLEGHLEAGQIEFRAARRNAALEFAIESWARSGDRLSDLLYTHLRMSKEVQLHMWTTVLERVANLAGGELSGGISVITRRGELDADDETSGTGRHRRRELRLLADLARRPVNFDPSDFDAARPGDGWNVDDMTEPLPAEPSGPSAPEGPGRRPAASCCATRSPTRRSCARPTATMRRSPGATCCSKSASQGFASTSEYGWARSMTRHAKSTNDRRASSAGTTAPWKGTSNRARCTTKSGNGSTPATSTSAYTHTRARPGAARSCYARDSAS